MRPLPLEGILLPLTSVPILPYMWLLPYVQLLNNVTVDMHKLTRSANIN